MLLFQLHLRAFWATAVREWRCVRRYSDNLLGAMLWPLIVPLLYVFEVKAFSGNASVSPPGLGLRTGVAHVAGFLYMGWLVASWVGAVLGQMSASLQNQLQRGTLETAFLSPAPRVCLLFGPAPVYLLLGQLTYFAVIGTLVVGFGVSVTWLALTKGLILMVFAGPAFAALGAVLSTTVVLMRSTGGLVECVRALFAALCGFTFPLVVLPRWASRLSAGLAPTWVARDLRGAVLGASPIHWGSLLLGLAITTAILGSLALIGFRVAESRARRTGHLGGY